MFLIGQLLQNATYFVPSRWIEVFVQLFDRLIDFPFSDFPHIWHNYPLSFQEVSMEIRDILPKTVNTFKDTEKSFPSHQWKYGIQHLEIDSSSDPPYGIS